MPSFAVLLQPSGWRFDADADTSVLAAAQAAGIKLPSSCRNGTCRACMCQLRAGAVRYRIEWPGLSRDEKDEGWSCLAWPTPRRRSRSCRHTPNASRPRPRRRLGP